MQKLEMWTKEEIIEEIRAKAASYVPEWRFDVKNPDIGTALALVYADMLAKTAGKFSQVFLKNQIAFLNELDAKLLPAVPAAGYVTFALVNDEVEGVLLPAGTVVSAQSEDDEIGLINYRTVDDVYVSPVRMRDIYHVCDRADYIAWVGDAAVKWTEAAFFELGGPGLTRHEMYLFHDEALDIRGSGWVQLSFYLRGGLRVPEALMRKLTDARYARIEYHSEAGYELFEQLEFEGDAIRLRKGAGQPGFAAATVDEHSGFALRLTITDMGPFEQLELAAITLRTLGRGIVPDSIYAGGMECNRNRYFPFGERITNYNEVYFGCGEVLGKKGAAVTLAFHLSFARIPMDFNVENDPVKWEWIMKRSDLKTDPEYDVTAEEVLWEYYNGTGWARLFPDNRHSDVFRPGGGPDGMYQTIEFRCPEDLQPLVIGSCESCYIRVRLIKVNNLFKQKGAYIAPMMADTVFEYDYLGHEADPAPIITCNNLECQRAPKADPDRMTVWRPFVRTGTPGQALYISFEAPLDQGPLKLFFQIKDNIDRTGSGLVWEYLSGSGWQELNVVDETGCFSRSGIVTIMGRSDFARGRMFGKEQYWMRITDLSGRYMPENRTAAYPVIQGIHMNTTRIMNVDKAVTELFRMEIYQENSRFALAARKIIRAEVFVNEGSDPGAEFSLLLKERHLRPVYDEAGMLQEAWVQWRQVEDFSESDEQSRDYVLDSNEGLIIFGNGRHGRIPPFSAAENIRVEYLSGGGAHTNVAANRIRQLNQDVGFISEVWNPEALVGGCDIELFEAALARSSARIRHQDRAITGRDYEAIAMAASRSIRRVRCFSGYGPDGERSPGAVTLVVLRADFSPGGSGFDPVWEAVIVSLQGKADGNLFDTGKLTVMEPEFVELSVRVEVTATGYNAAFQVKKQVHDRLTAFLNPLTGNFHNQGWEIGQLPNNIQIRNAISDIPNLAAVGNLYVTAFVSGRMGRREADLERVSQNRYILPVSGQHEVIINIR